MIQPEIERIAAGLSEAQKRALLWLSDTPQSWPKGSEASLYCLSKMIKGNPETEVCTFAILAKTHGRAEAQKGAIWGKSLWAATPLGLAVRQHLKDQADD